jgi:phosphatidylethanolamine/phosphatidyl-N-methylethanolamine N-methyltransferase
LKLNDIPLFLRQVRQSPGHVGAVIPSSPVLGRNMAQKIGAAPEHVVEIGAGTGALSREILASGIAPANLTIFEMNSDFCTRLRREFPDVTVHNRMAQDMGMLGIRDVCAVVSGLPLLNMPEEVQMSIAQAVFKALKPGAPMVQFTYGLKPPLARPVREALDLEWTKSRRVWRNLPPATIYTFRKKTPHCMRDT